MAKLPRSHAISRDDQLSALVSWARQELLDVLSRMGASSVTEIAATLGRPPDALYYHLRSLVRVGLVESAGFRRRAGREEALFRTVAPEIMIRYGPPSAARDRRLTGIVGSMLRLGARDYRRALDSPEVVVTGSRRELWALRTTGWLSPAQIATVNRNIHRLMGSVSKPRGRGRLYGVTVLLTPLDHRARKGARGARGASR
jgi:DNA-binding transcriptional ArsR family regulator